jgi:agmatine deiminase
MTSKPEGTETPAALGFAMPAEWESHEATWIAWPHNRSDWPGKMATIPLVYAEIIRKIVPGELVRLLVNSELLESQARSILTRAGVDLSRIEFFRFPTNRSWVRDTGPIFVKRKRHNPEIAVARFRFNAWAKYKDCGKDDLVAERAAEALGYRIFRARVNGQDVVLEGGSIDVNGHGTLLTTEECLLDTEVQARNPHLSRKELEAVMSEYLGVKNILWLGRGIVGDDTHGHIDDVCRFVGPRTVVLCRESDPHDENHPILEENYERLQGMRAEDDSKIEVINIPMPSPLYCDGQRVPASYANFYISNSAVLVPTFNDPNDRVALGVLSELFPGRRVVGIHAVDLVWGLGTIHCLTQQQPSL